MESEINMGGGNMVNFDQTYYILFERCEQADLNRDECWKHFFIVSLDSALQYYFDFIRGKGMELWGLVVSMKKMLYTYDQTRMVLCEWKSISLTFFFNENIGKRPSECPKFMTNSFQDIQVSLPGEYRNDKIMWKKYWMRFRRSTNARLLTTSHVQPLKAYLQIYTLPQRFTQIIPPPATPTSSIEGTTRRRSTGGREETDATYVKSRDAGLSSIHSVNPWSRRQI